MFNISEDDFHAPVPYPYSIEAIDTALGYVYSEADVAAAGRIKACEQYAIDMFLNRPGFYEKASGHEQRQVRQALLDLYTYGQFKPAVLPEPQVRD
jgi:hypothetical protein